jgi:outer membrane protein assembly factor BamB
MRATRIRVLAAAAAAGALSAAAVGLACGDSGDENAGRADGAAPPLPPLGSGDGSVKPPPSDAEVSPGDVCGDRSGLQKNASWPLKGGCPTRAGWTTAVGPRSPSARFVPALGGKSAPAVATNGLAWVGTEDGYVIAANTTGVKWAKQTGGPVRSSPAIDADGVAIALGGDGVLYGLADAPSQTPGDATRPEPAVRFSRSLGATTSSPVIGPDRSIYIGTGDGKLASLTKDLGSIRWAVDTHDTSGSSPALGQDGTVYVGSSDHHLYAVGPDGSLKWSFDVEAEVRGSCAVGGDGTVYLTTARRLWAVTSAGAKRWTADLPAETTGELAVYATAIYVPVADKRLHALATPTGNELWTYETDGDVSMPLITADGLIFVGSTDTHVYALNGKGGLVFAASVKGKVVSAPAPVSGPSIYVMTDNALVAVGP